VWGVSDNTRSWFSLEEARALGYEPVDDSETFAAEHEAATPDSLAERYVGGAFCSRDFDTADQESGR
jgi:uronate dehydrogenase